MKIKCKYTTFMSAIHLESLLIILTLSLASNAKLDSHLDLVFRRCSAQKLVDCNRTYADARNRLLGMFVSESSQSRFGRDYVMVEVGDGYSSSSVSGMFQCRGDLDGHGCNECIKAIPNISYGLCGKWHLSLHGMPLLHL